MTKKEAKAHNKFLPVIAAVAIQLCLGVAYIWSVFQTGISSSIFNGDNAAASLTFSLLLSSLSIGGVIGGKLVTRFSTRPVIIAGGIILSIGFFAASFVTNEAPWLLWITYGLIGGVGMGFTYSTSIACAQKWFPHKKGLVTGIIVSALGFGGVVFTPIVEYLIKFYGGQGSGELKTFKVLSLIFLVVCTLGGLFLNNPPENYFKNHLNGAQIELKSYSPKQILKNPQFYLITFVMLLACMGGLMMIGFAKPFAVAKGLGSVATVGVLLISVFNSFGRLFWGWVSDKAGRIKTIILLLFGTAILSLLVNSVSGYWVFVLIAFIGFFYGGILGTFPSLTSDLFGPKFMATNYGMVLLGFGVGAVISSYIAGYYKNIAVDNINLMFPAFVIAATCAMVGIILMFIVAKLEKKRAK